MLFRQILLVLGAVALLAGIGLSVIWVQTPSAPVDTRPATPQAAVLIAARELPAGSLLRSEDLKWAEIAAAEVPPGAFVRSGASESEPLGAATRRGFRAGEPLLGDQIIKPSEAGFLPAVLGPGMRATSIAVDPAEGGSGLIAPGDHVDVILTQTFDAPGIRASFRSVGETVLRDLRVIAIDQTINGAGAPGTAGLRNAVPAEARLPKTVTVEVSVHQAEMLMVAGRLGKLQLTLRSLHDRAAVRIVAPPTWAADVSPALKYFERDQLPAGPEQGGAPPPPLAIDIIRGGKGEHHCFAPATGVAIDCAATEAQAAPSRPPGAAAPAPAPPPAEGPSLPRGGGASPAAGRI